MFPSICAGFSTQAFSTVGVHHLQAPLSTLKGQRKRSSVFLLACLWVPLRDLAHGHGDQLKDGLDQQCIP